MSGFARYSRQVALRELGVNGQRMLRDSSVLVIGLGGLGSVAAHYLAGAGIGRLSVCDRDRVEWSNLHRQTLYAESDVGREKTEAACARLGAVNREVRVEACAPQELPDRIATVDLVMDCTDNFPARHAHNALCVRHRKPLVSGAAIRFEGQVALFDPIRAESACYACLYPQSGPEQESCEEAGILGPVAGVVGALQALMAIKRLAGIGDDAGTLRVWNAHTLEWKTLRLKRDPQCPVCRR